MSHSKKTEHAGAKKGRGAFYGRKADAKEASNHRRRARQAILMMLGGRKDWARNSLNDPEFEGWRHVERYCATEPLRSQQCETR